MASNCYGMASFEVKDLKWQEPEKLKKQMK